MNASETIVLLLLLLLLFGKDVCRIRHGLRRTFSSLFRKLRMKRRIWIERDREGIRAEEFVFISGLIIIQIFTNLITNLGRSCLPIIFCGQRV